MKRKLVLPALVVAVLSITPLRADPPTAAEVKLREMLKSTTIQLRNAQNDLATAQATAADDEQKIKDLTDANDQLTKKSIADKEATDKTIADLTQKNTAQAAQLVAYKDALAKWEAGYKLAATAAKEKETERARLNSVNIVLQRAVDDLIAKNLNLFQTANDILTRYEKFSLGQALAAKEPFLGLTRVKLQNQVQGYEDKLISQKYVAPSAETPAQTATPAPPGVVNNKTSK